MATEDRQLHVRLPGEVFTRLKVKCAYEGTSMQDYIVTLVAQSLGGLTPLRGVLLIVEDEDILRESLKEALKETHDVTMAGTAEEALELIKQQDFDILITDVRLPGKSGLQLVKEVKEAKPYVRSIVMTAYPSVELAVEAMKQGAVDYLIKPIHVESLEKLILDVLVKSRSATESGPAGVRSST